MAAVRMLSRASGSSTGMPVASVPSSPGARVCSSMSATTGRSRSMAAPTLRPSVCGAMSTPARAQCVHCRSMGWCSRYLSHRASTMSVSPSLPPSTIAGGVGALTIVSSLGHATRSSRRSTTMMRAGTTSSFSHLECPTVVISAPHCGQIRECAGTGLSTCTRDRCAGMCPRPG